MTPAVFLAAALASRVTDHRLEPPPAQRDARVYYSAPHSLHLDATAGSHFFALPDRPVRPATRYRLRFRYLVALDTPGEPCVRLAQYQDSPLSWKVLPAGCFDVPMSVVGRWSVAERVFETDREATTAMIYLRLDTLYDVGEAWIDDLELRPVGEPLTVGP